MIWPESDVASSKDDRSTLYLFAFKINFFKLELNSFIKSFT
jgi:hypothetical protein